MSRSRDTPDDPPPLIGAAIYLAAASRDNSTKDKLHGRVWKEQSYTMTTPLPIAATVLILVLVTASPARPQSSSSSAGSSSHSGSGHTSGNGTPSTAEIPAAVSSGWSRYYPFYLTTMGPSGEVYSYIPPAFAGLGFRPVIVLPAASPRPTFDPGPVAPLPPPGLIRQARQARQVVKARQGDPARASQLLTLGDRMFRIDDWKRAEDRYRQAARLDPDSAAPRVRLAQIAIARERYHEAADRLREAETVQPGWIATARDVQAIYAEPADFAECITKLQSHLHAHPGDRDAWLVLGAQWFLSGRAGQAADVFHRLDDPHRRPDVALAAFLDATKQPRAPEPLPNALDADGGDPFRPPVDEP